MVINRRSLMLGAGGSLLARAYGNTKKTIGAVITEYRPMSHADVICGRIFNGYTPNGVRVEPRTQIVSMYTDQVPDNDTSREHTARHGCKIYPTISEALTRGGDSLAVEAVLLIGEHGKYPLNEIGQKLYPRYELFQQIVEVFRKSRRSVPVFSDKHLSWSWDHAKQMYDESKELGFPMMAGSSIPVTPRVPSLEVPFNAPIEHAVAVGYSDVEAYGFHTLESLQCMIERRAGGETGVSAVQALRGKDVWEWHDSRNAAWARPLLDAALARDPVPKKLPPREGTKDPALFLLEYRDGLRAAVYMLDRYLSTWLFAGTIKGKPDPISTHFGPIPHNRELPHFDGLVRCIEEFFVTGKPVYPVERTLLTTGMLAFLMQSRHSNQRIETPQLKIAYHAPKHTWFQQK
jgi:hypothetical protein